jgi:hypothetical protein
MWHGDVIHQLVSVSFIACHILSRLRRLQGSGATIFANLDDYRDEISSLITDKFHFVGKPNPRLPERSGIYIYINTVMLQRVLARQQWSRRLTAKDIRAMTPLIWEHVNPYGRLELDMEATTYRLTPNGPW